MRSNDDMQAALTALRSQPTINVAQAAVVLGVGQAVLRRAIDDGEIVVVRLGRNIRVVSEPIKRQLALEEEPA